MDTKFLNSKSSKASDLHRPLLNLSDEINFKRSDIYVALSNLSIYYTQKLHYEYTKKIASTLKAIHKRYTSHISDTQNHI